jgi:HPt (histidine-containing phosphotransfer) domain-containing protein
MNSAFDLDKLHAMRYGDADVERSILEDFLTITRDDEKQLAIYLDDNDYVNIRQCVHRIKGASHVVAATTLFEACESVEAATLDEARMPAAREQFAHALREVYASGEWLLSRRDW